MFCEHDGSAMSAFVVGQCFTLKKCLLLMGTIMGYTERTVGAESRQLLFHSVRVSSER